MDVYDYANSSRALTVIEEKQVEITLKESLNIYPHAGDMFNAYWRRELLGSQTAACRLRMSHHSDGIIKLTSIKQSQNPVICWLGITMSLPMKRLSIACKVSFPYDEKKAVNPPAYIFK